MCWWGLGRCPPRKSKRRQRGQLLVWSRRSSSLRCKSRVPYNRRLLTLTAPSSSCWPNAKKWTLQNSIRSLTSTWTTSTLSFSAPTCPTITGRERSRRFSRKSCRKDDFYDISNTNQLVSWRCNFRCIFPRDRSMMTGQCNLDNFGEHAMLFEVSLLLPSSCPSCPKCCFESSGARFACSAPLRNFARSLNILSFTYGSFYLLQGLWKLAECLMDHCHICKWKRVKIVLTVFYSWLSGEPYLIIRELLQLFLLS